ncbi:alpha/beta fold hydrolase [Nocardia sp. NPDC127526]|uniref:alpha/beta fold hydrolase n=1 Tax=Nocardia sp. NPDC127526 TaxID=3345393 RepID=UPI003638F88E
MTAKADALQHFTVHHDGVVIPVSHGGRGRPLVLCPGLTSSRAELHELGGFLRRDHHVISFDLRGHGLSSAADRYAFEAFAGDFAAVMAAVERLDLPAPPVLAGHSYGADLIVHHAAEFPGVAAELVLIDGANPIPEPFITEADLPEFRELWENLATWQETLKGTPRQVLLTPRQILDLNLELDVIRTEQTLDRFRAIDCPITMIMSAAMAGHGTEGRTPQRNRNWRAGIERLVRELPQISVTWLEATHALVVTHAREIAGRLATC